MKKVNPRLSLFLILPLLLGALGLSNAAAMPEAGWLPFWKDASQPQSLTAISLRESDDGLNWTDTVLGGLNSGFIMALSGTPEGMEYLDVASLTASPSLTPGDYPFILDVARLPESFYPYWDAQGVNAAATPGSWQAAMWQIINGQLPIFYLRAAAAGSHLIDGLAYQREGSGTTQPVRVSSDYPLHTYNFQGTLNFSDGSSQTMVLGISYTHQATAELRLGGSEAETIVIDGCGFVDVTLHLHGVSDDLYALSFELGFDPALVEVVDLDGVQAGVNLQPLAPWNGSGAYTALNIAYNSDNPDTPANEAGKIYFSAGLLNPSAALNGNLDVAVLRLRSKSLGAGQLSFSQVALSDRDGYLIGAPVIFGGPLQGAYALTTQFSTAAGLELAISRLDADTVRLSWPQGAAALVSDYKLHRSTTPYFTAGTGTVYQTISNDGSTTHQFDDDVLGNVTNNYFYALQVGCSSGLQSPASWQVGKFEYMLYETESTNYSLVGLVLENSQFVNTSTLAQHIEENSVPPVDVLSVGSWNGNGQTFEYPLFTPLSVYLKMPYQIEIDIPGTTNETSIWAQVGRLPAISTDTYTLYETAETSFSWILQPLDMPGIHNSDELAQAIALTAQPITSVSEISWWNGTAQTFESDPFLPFATRFGYPYRVQADVTAPDMYSLWP